MERKDKLLAAHVLRRYRMYVSPKFSMHICIFLYVHTELHNIICTHIQPFFDMAFIFEAELRIDTLGPH